MPEDKKRTYCLYRVSTLGQVEKDDIPMQKQACREFAESQNWEITKEFSEKGVSGFKTSAKDRDAIQEIQKDAVAGKFDVLLVFMFDRIGRREDETPFVVEWFVKEGVEVWSVREGQQRFDSHVDKLTNYIRYWQASGESIKTSIRTKTRLGQIVQEGRFRGGSPAFGYKVEKQGRLNKKNQEVNEIVIDETEAAVVQKIFDLYLNQGYGSQRIATHLIDHGIFNRSGNSFTNTTIQHMLKNRSYLGVLKSGDTESEIFSHLQIIDPESFELVQDMIKQRSSNYKDRRIPLNTKGSSLLSGNIFCGHCDGRLNVTTNGKKYVRKDGETKIIPRTRYVCYNKTRHKNKCDGQTGYTVIKLDGIVEKIAREFFSQLHDTPREQLILERFREKKGEYQVLLSSAKEAHKSALSEMQELELEVMKIIRGESALSSDLVNKLYNEAKEKAESTSRTIKKVESEMKNSDGMYDELSRKYDQLLSWAELYDSSTNETKKMILSKIFGSVKVRRGYELEIDLNVSLEQIGIEFQQNSAQEYDTGFAQQLG